ncbi:hypothetical protein [Lysobacter brunescens]|uniref:Uncharacterized protein n=1 Tax=Lysobacter brunescens TaxID=262323 RepID=A0ABW2YKJ5_9GAMM
MNDSRTPTEADDDGLPSFDRVLRYEKHLPGEGFVQGVMKAAVRRRRRRTLVLGASAAVSAALTVAIMPEKFALPQNLGVVLERIGSSADSLASIGPMALLLATILLIGASRTIDNI